MLPPARKTGKVTTEDEHCEGSVWELAEQRAMHVVHRYQTLSVKMSAHEGARSAVEPEALPPVAPPISLYANLPQEWP